MRMKCGQAGSADEVLVYSWNMASHHLTVDVLSPPESSCWFGGKGSWRQRADKHLSRRAARFNSRTTVPQAHLHGSFDSSATGERQKCLRSANDSREFIRRKAIIPQTKSANCVVALQVNKFIDNIQGNVQVNKHVRISLKTVHHDFAIYLPQEALLA